MVEAQPIETAPKDGTRILIWQTLANGGRWEVTYWRETKSVTNGKIDYESAGWAHIDFTLAAHFGQRVITHWAPLPGEPT